MNENIQRLKLLYKVVTTLNASFDQLNFLSLEQLEFINHQLRLSSYLTACPGSGKTEVVGIKAAYEISKWQHKFSGFAILSFTRNSANEIKKRVITYAGINGTNHPHYIGTFDSWLHNYILQPFAHKIMGYTGKNNDKSIRIIDNYSKAHFLYNYITKLFKNNQLLKIIWINEFYINIDGKIETENDSLSNIDNNIRKQLIINKKKFFQDGFATYQDAEYLCSKIIKSTPIGQIIADRFPVIIVDECQDLSPSQLSILAELNNRGAVLHFIGDMNQAIYEFRKVDPSLTGKYINDNNFKKKLLSNNFRSNQKIVDFCQKLIGEENRRLIGMQDIRFTPSCILWQYSDIDFLDLPERFKKLLIDKKICTDKAVILARGKAILKKLHPQEQSNDKPVELFANALNCWYGVRTNTESITSALNEIGKAICYLANKVRGNVQMQHCPAESASIDWRLFLAKILRDAKELYPFIKGDGNDLTWSIWVKRLKEFLEKNWENIPFRENDWEDAARKIIAPKGKANINVSESIIIPSKKSNINITTIHSVKGRTFDAVLLISSPDKKSKGGHFEHWIDKVTGNEEHKRFAYVACSRPKHLLIIATPKLETQHLEILKKMGLEED